MKAIWVWGLSLLSVLSYNLTQGNYYGYYNSYDLYKKLDDLQEVNSDLLVTTKNNSIESASFNVNKLGSVYNPIRILVIGGFDSNPMSAFNVLNMVNELINRMRKDYTSNFISVLNSLQIDLYPILNLPAYQYMEKGNIEIFQTDFTGSSWNCSSPDAGINPYYNYPHEWAPSSVKCSQVYPGNSSLESNVTKIFNYTTYNFIISFHSTVKAYATPYAFNSNSLNSLQSYFYSKLKQYIPQEYRYDSLYNINNAIAGTLLDSAIDKGVYSLQIGSDYNACPICIQNSSLSGCPECLLSQSLPHTVFLQSVLSDLYSQPNITFIQANESACNTKACSSMVTAIFQIYNPRAVATFYDFNLILNFETNAAFTLNSVSAYISYFYGNDDGPKSLNLAFTNRSGSIVVSNTIPEFSGYNLTFLYYRSNDLTGDNFTLSYRIKPHVGAYYFDTIYNTVEGYIARDNPSSSSTNLKEYVVIGLLSVVGVVSAIAIICFVLTPKHQLLIKE